MATRGQPKIEAWEQWRATAWANEVRRLAQIKMAKMPLPASDPFARIGILILARWSKPQRLKKNPNQVIMTDLDETLLGSKRTDFHHYANGTKARPRASTLNAVDKVLPGTKRFFEIGSNGVPLWAALRGKITPKDFWEPLVRTGQVTDTLDLFQEDTDWQAEGRTHPRPSLVGKRGTVLTPHEVKVLNGMIAYESTARLPNLPWKELVQALANHMVPLQFREDQTLALPFKPRRTDGSKPSPFHLMPPQLREGLRLEASMIEQQTHVLNISMGDAVLAIALAHRARLHHFSSKHCPPESCDDLRNILEGLIPIWKRWENYYHLGTAITDEIKQLAAPL